MAEIMTFFKTIISKYFVRDTECKELADIAASIFDWQRALHQRVFVAYGSAEA